MGPYIVRRLLQALITVLLVTIILFVILHNLPGGPARAILGPRATAVQIAFFEREYGLNQPLAQQYSEYLLRLVHGNLGYSYQLNQSVTSLLGERLPKTLLLTALATVVALSVAVPMGVLQAYKRNRPIDFMLTAVAFTLYGMPVFLLGLALVFLFGITWHVLPAEGPQTGNVVAVLEAWRGLVLPVVTLAGVNMALFMRYTRSSVADVLSEEFIRTAKAKGDSPIRVFRLHAMRNAALPMVTLLGLILPALFGGAIVVEYLFNYPGMGLLLWNSAQSRDYPVILGVTIVLAAMTVIGSLVADIGYAVLDPRIRLGGGQ